MLEGLLGNGLPSNWADIAVPAVHAVTVGWSSGAAAWRSSVPGLSASLISPSLTARLYRQRNGPPSAPERCARRGRCGGHDVGLDVDHQLGYLLGRTAALVMALPRSRVGKLTATW